MRLLLDTHAFLWFVLDSPQLSTSARALTADPANDVLVSPATCWEIAIKVSLNKLDLHTSFEDFMTRAIEGSQLELLPITTRHLSVVSRMPFHHRDPFDRLIIAQAVVENIGIVSVDPAFDSYGIARFW